jgi:hypothetical protein
MKSAGGVPSCCHPYKHKGCTLDWKCDFFFQRNQHFWFYRGDFPSCVTQIYVYDSCLNVHVDHFLKGRTSNSMMTSVLIHGACRDLLHSFWVLPHESTVLSTRVTFIYSLCGKMPWTTGGKRLDCLEVIALVQVVHEEDTYNCFSPSVYQTALW